MTDATDVPGLARELGVKIVDILDWARKIGLPVRRGAARLTAPQANRLREEWKAGRLVPRASRPKVAPGPPSPRSEVFKCSCCGFHFEYNKDGSPPEHCIPCSQHYPKLNESQSRIIDRLTEHDGRWRTRVAQASKKATEYEERMRDALRSRDVWKRTLVEIVVAHDQLEDGSCCCGADNFPCVTRRQLEESNRGIARQIELLEGLSEKELQKFLHGDDGVIAEWE